MIKKNGILSEVNEKDIELLQNHPNEFWSDIVEIDQEAFKNLNIIEIEIPNTITKIGYSAFQNCLNLKNVILHDGLRHIDKFAFANCQNLKNINFPNTIENISTYAFAQTALVSVRIPESIKEVESYAFSNCNSLEEVILPQTVEILYTNTFHKCSNLQKVIISEETINYENFHSAYVIKYEDIQKQQKKQEEAKNKIDELFNNALKGFDGLDR